MRVPALVGLVVALAVPASAGQDPFGTAKDLYASAAYEEALSTLAQVPDGAGPEVARQINQYRAFCLFALGRTMEAEQIAEMLIRQDPLVDLTDGEVSPRIETMFATVRKRVLPGLIRDEYKTARLALDNKDLKGAEPHLVRVSQMLTEMRDNGGMDETLSDLSLLVDGFLGLSRATAEQQAVRGVAPAATPAASAPAPAAPAPALAAPAAALTAQTRAPAPAPVAAPPAPAVVAAAPVSGSSGGGGTAAGGIAPARAETVTALADRAPAPARAAVGNTIFAGPGDSHLTPPVAVSQDVPELPPAVAGMMKWATRKTVVLDLIVNEKGDVQDVSVMEGAQPLYDFIVLKAARQWKYHPATLDGVPVKFRKSVTVAVRDQ